MKPRTILVILVGLAVWAVATKQFMDWRETNRREEAKAAARAEARKPPPPPPPPKFGPGKGDFETYFTETSELSTKPEMLRRLRLKPQQLLPTTNPSIAPGTSEDTYDIAKQIFRIYVPDKVGAAVPQGIIYYLPYKDSIASPPDWPVTLNAKHYIFISPRYSVRPEWQQAAIMLDAMHNLKKQYTIDSKRIYLFEFSEGNGKGVIGTQIALGLADQLTGVAHIDRLSHFRNVPVPATGGLYPPHVAPPPPDLLATTLKLPRVYVLQDSFYLYPSQPDRRPLYMNAFKADGFAHTLLINIADGEQLHYPHFSGPWLEQTLAFLENPQ